MKQKGIAFMICVLCWGLLLSCRARSQSPYEQKVIKVQKRSSTPLIGPALLMMEPSFTYVDPATETVYILRRVDQEEIVTVKDADEMERLATMKEQAFLLAKLEYDWKRRTLDQKMTYHYENLRREQTRSRSLIDQMIRLKMEAITELESYKNNLDIQIHAHEQENHNLEEAAILQVRSDSYAEEIESAYKQLGLLKYKKWIRDEAERKETTPFAVEAFPIRTFAERHYLRSESKLLTMITTSVAPGSWLKWYASIQIKDDHLLVCNSPEVIEELRAYLQQ